MNKGYDPAEIERLKKQMEMSGKPFQYIDEDEVSPEMAEFFFIGTHQGRPVVFDCLLGTLRLAYEARLDELAEARARARFPDYKGFDFVVDDAGNAVRTAEEDEDVEAYKAYAMFEIEEAGEARVAESVEVDEQFDYGVGLEAYLNIPEITEAEIARFITAFNSGSLALDPVEYAFESESDEED
jgi:hypothetical protein